MLTKPRTRTAPPRTGPAERVYLSESERTRLVAVATKLLLSKSEVMRRALDAYCTQHEN